MPCSSLAYKTALTKRLTGDRIPTFLVRQEAVKFSRLILCTLYRVITGHAFIGSCSQRVFPQPTGEQVVCPCGELVRTSQESVKSVTPLPCLSHAHVSQDAPSSTHLLRPTPRAAWVRSLAHEAASDASNVPERSTAAAAGLLPGGE
jgi:hypothetical protein